MSETNERYVRPFSDVLRDIRNGDLHDELGERLAQIVEAVGVTGKAGKLTVTLNVKPGPARGTVLVLDEVKPAVPEERSAVIFYIGAHGLLSRRDPNQPELFGPDSKPRIVNTQTGEIKEIETA